MIFGPKDDSTYVVEFRTAEGDVLAISGLDEEKRKRLDGAVPRTRDGCC